MPVANCVNCGDPYDEERENFVLYAEGGEFRCADCVGKPEHRRPTTQDFLDAAANPPS